MITTQDYLSKGLNTFLTNLANMPVAQTNALPGLPQSARITPFYRCHYNYGFYYAGYCQQKITYTQMCSPTIPTAISKGFSGCAMAYFVYKHIAYVAHIALEANYFDDRHKWNDFIIWQRQNITRYAIFRPAKTHIDRSMDIVGLITPQLECYSILVNKASYNPITIHQCTPREIHATTDLSRIIDISQFLIPARTRGTSW